MAAPVLPPLATLQSIADVRRYVSTGQRTLVLWDADDTLVATAPGAGPRGRLLESAEALEEAFLPGGEGGRVEHKVLSAGSIDDLFHRTELCPKDKVPLLAHLAHKFRSSGEDGAPPRVVYVPPMKQHVVFTSDLLGITTRASKNVAPSPHSVTLEAQKVDVALACALSAHWDHVLLVDNQTMEVGWVQPGLSAAAYTCAETDPAEVFSTEYMRVHTALHRHGAACKLTLAHLRVSETHKVLPGEKPLSDAEYQSLTDRLHAFNVSAVPMVTEYFDNHVDVAADYGPVALCRASYAAALAAATAETSGLADLLSSGADGTQDGRVRIKAAAKAAEATIARLPVVDAAHNSARGALHRIAYSPGGAAIAEEVKKDARDAFASLRMHDA
eukprot:TRINITY_DN2022_c0_g1_i3.p1 TRINITY_DN2022_c0_g1~~TRINITY_DN2022_c0_g1_i3.p1  ORF type:complete len:407 (+),score=141.70 TRINITY_DN2022_c0_g1_i3:63-1223(+)